MVSTPSATVRGSSDKKKLHCIAGNMLCESRERKGENVQGITKLLLPKCEHRQSMGHLPDSAELWCNICGVMEEHKYCEDSNSIHCH